MKELSYKDKFSYTYDLHIHSCLSPCGDNDMTPNSIVNMAYLKARDIIALSDHNTTKNCRAAIEAAKDNELPLIVVPAVEVTTSEEIHVLILFPDIESAEAFEAEIIEPRRIKIKNNPKIFGEQIIMDENDEKIGEYEYLLINALDLSVDEIKKKSSAYKAAAIPAHIDKPENGLLSILGSFPDYIGFCAVEIKDSAKNEEIIKKYNLRGITALNDSDAHYLWDITEENDSGGDNIIYSDFEIKTPADLIKFITKA